MNPKHKALEKGKKLKVRDLLDGKKAKMETRYFSGGRGTKTSKRHMAGDLGHRYEK